MPLLAFFSLILLAQLAYLVALRSGFRSAVDEFARALRGGEAAPSPVSVIVAARNEERDLPILLEALSRQTHPEFEVIVVDDGSTDATPPLVREWQKGHPNVRLVTVEKPVEPRKKHALTQGIAAARHELLAFTDADCAPRPHWLEDAARCHAAQPVDTLLIGYSPFRETPGLLNRFSRYETFLTGYLTAAAAGLGRAYMAVGRNLVYTRTLFRRTGGFADTLQSMSGDDDLFVQQVRTKRTGRILHLFGLETYVPTTAPETWHQWFRQKIRHTSAGRFYPRDVKLHLTLYHATSTLLWIAPLVVGWWGALYLGIRLVTQGVFLAEGARLLGEERIYPAQPFLEFLYAIYNIFVAPLGLIRMPAKW